MIAWFVINEHIQQRGLSGGAISHRFKSTGHTQLLPTPPYLPHPWRQQTPAVKKYCSPAAAVTGKKGSVTSQVASTPPSTPEDNTESQLFVRHYIEKLWQGTPTSPSQELKTVCHKVNHRTHLYPVPVSSLQSRVDTWNQAWVLGPFSYLDLHSTLGSRGTVQKDVQLPLLKRGHNQLWTVPTGEGASVVWRNMENVSNEGHIRRVLQQRQNSLNTVV